MKQRVARIVVLARVVAAVALCAGLSLASGAVGAQSKRLALVIGNADYQFEARLQNPTFDAQLIAKTLRDLGFDVTEHNNLNQLEMVQVVTEFSDKTPGADVAVIYFSGHGMKHTDARVNYLLPVDIPDASASANVRPNALLKARALPETELLAAISNAKMHLLILDACRNTSSSARPGSKSADKGLYRSSAAGQGLIAYATDEGKLAKDGAGRYSPYAESLARHLSARRLPLLAALDQVADEVSKATQGEQLPTRAGNLRADAVLAPLLSNASVPVAEQGAASPVVDAEGDVYALARTKNTAQAWRAYLNAYPSGRYVAAANAAITMLEPAPVLLEGRYELLNNGSEVRDLQTLLIWQRCSVGQTWSGSTCAGEAKHFTFDQAQMLAGNGWRVPTIRELRSLIWCSDSRTTVLADPKDGGPPLAAYCAGEPGKDYVKPTIRSTAFPNTPSSYVWSGSPFAGNSSYAWYAHFGNGNVGSWGRSDASSVRLVRGEQ